MALVPGSSAGPYRIVEPLGRGGMASVYKAYESKLDRYVALKVLPREFLHDPNFAQRFRQEARVIARLEHPNIIPIYAYDIDEQDGIPWMAMRLLKAGSLADLLKRERLARGRGVAILRGTADALDYAHGQGIVHRDVKPQNVLLDESGRVYLADFGIAKILESSGGLTASGMITGTPQYMAPEQATGLKIGPAADVYALGIVAYEMLTGRVPFSADTPVAVLMKHVQEPLPLPPLDVVPEPMLRALLKATAKKPEDRWPTAGAFVAGLSAGLDAPIAITSAPTVAIPREAAPAPGAAPTVVFPKPPSAPSGTAPPLPPRPPVLRPPPARSDAPVAPVRRTPVPAAVFALGGLTVLGVVALAAAWLWLASGRSGPPGEAGPPQASPPPPSVGGPAVVAQATPSPARERASPMPIRTPAPAAPAASDPTTAPTPRPAPAPATPTPPPVPVSTPAPAPPIPAAPAVDAEIERLAAQLSDRDAATRRQAAQDLAARGPQAAPAVTALIGALVDRSPDVRLRAAEALGRVGPAAREAATPLAQALRDTDPLVAAEAAKALGQLGEAASGSGAAGALGSALGHRDVAVRREAARALARIGRGAEPALAALMAALSDKDKTVCAQSARALGRIGPAAGPAVPRLTALSRDPDVLVSREAQAALESIGRPSW